MIGQMYKIFGQVICQLDKKHLVKKHLNTNKNIEMVFRMRIWCIPASTVLDNSTPLLPPRIDRDVFYRSPPPPPRLSRQQKLDRGVIVLKPKKNRLKKVEIKQKVEVPKKRVRKVRYADQEQFWVTPEVKPAEKVKESIEEDKKEKDEDVFCDICCFQDRCTHEEVWRQRAEDLLQKQEIQRPPSRGTEVIHSRQQSNTSGTSSCLTLGSSLTTPSSHASPSSGAYNQNFGLNDEYGNLSFDRINLHTDDHNNLNCKQHDLSYNQIDPGYSSSSGCGSSGIRFLT